jgi:hypothetical protein
MTCSEFRIGIQEHLDRRGERTLSDELLQHQSHCHSCADYWKSLQVLDGVLRGIPRAEISPEFVRALYSVPKKHSWALSIYSTLRRIAPFATAAVVYAVGVILFPYDRLILDLALVTFAYTFAFSSLLTRPILGMRR